LPFIDDWQQELVQLKRNMNQIFFRLPFVWAFSLHACLTKQENPFFFQVNCQGQQLIFVGFQNNIGTSWFK
jgi:hypothetical protein